MSFSELWNSERRYAVHTKCISFFSSSLIIIIYTYDSVAMGPSAIYTENRYFTLEICCYLNDNYGKNFSKHSSFDSSLFSLMFDVEHVKNEFIQSFSIFNGIFRWPKTMAYALCHFNNAIFPETESPFDLRSSADPLRMCSTRAQSWMSLMASGRLSYSVSLWNGENVKAGFYFSNKNFVSN